MNLQELGFDQWFEAHRSGFSPEGCGVARIVAVDRGAYLIKNEAGEVPAELFGKLSYQIESAADLPCVGDWVSVRYYNDDALAIIQQVFPRKTFLRRKSAGENIALQMIAANIDTAFIVQSCREDFNPRRLDRYLVMAADGHVEPIVLLTKTDLIPGEELQQKLEIVASATNARVLGLSSVTGRGLDAFRRTLSPGRTYCLLGSSGVGKTTLINRLVGREAYETRPVSGTGEGTHTTSRRQLIRLAEGAMLIDTPGMRELGLVAAGDGIRRGFGDLAALSAGCRYADCTHVHEPGCAVRSAVETGQLSEDRYASYIKLKKESEYNEMSYLDKRKKDRDFGRFIKTVKKRVKTPV